MRELDRNSMVDVARLVRALAEYVATTATAFMVETALRALGNRAP